MRERRWWFVGLGGIVGVLFLLSGGMLWTSRPSYCRSCHQIVPYYTSWAVSAHNQVPCGSCHWDPGIGGMLQAKWMGVREVIQQLRGGEDIPLHARIPDRRCVPCHDVSDEALNYREVPFRHIQHMSLAWNEGKIACTACHYQPNPPVEGIHIPTPAQPCYQCHLYEKAPERLRDCLMCHRGQLDREPPTARFSHALILAQKVACLNCHEDLTEGKGRVPPSNCGKCHAGRVYDPSQWPSPEVHRIHVANEARAACEDCHTPIVHSFTSAFSPELEGTSPSE